MFDELINFAEEIRPALIEQMRTTLPFSAVQGAILEVDPFWLEAAWFDQVGSTDKRTAYLPSFPRYDTWQTAGKSAVQSPMYLDNCRNADAAWLSWSTRFDPRFKLSLGARPDEWKYHCGLLGIGDEPTFIRIILRFPEHGGVQISDKFPPRFGRYRIVYEYRPVAVAANALYGLLANFSEWVSPSDADRLSIGRDAPRTTGTLGGYMRCAGTGTTYAVSCAHVLGTAGPVFSPGPYEGRSSQVVGSVEHAVVPPLNTGFLDCNLTATPSAGRLDLSVARLTASIAESPTFALQPLSVRPASKMNTNQPVFITGKESGRTEALLSGVTIWLSIDFEDFGQGPSGSRCFGTLFSMAPARERQRIVARSGDSGAWIYDQAGNVTCWDGMLMAVQGSFAYACYSEFIAQECASRFPGGITFSGLVQQNTFSGG